VIDSFLGVMAALTLVHPASAAGLIRPLPTPVPIVQDVNQPVVAAPKKKDPNRLGIETTSRAVFVADVKTGQVLYAKRPHDVLPIASLTKLMTAMVYMDTEPDLDAPITILAEDFADEGKGVFAIGDVMTQRQAFEALMIGSVNTAGNALARVSLGKEAFVKAMNDKARALHLASPVFVEPTGLDPRNRASVADVAAMLSTALSYPTIRTITSKSQIVFQTQGGHSYKVDSTNLLLGTYLSQKPYQIIGAKTGSLPEAGYCMSQVTRDAAGHEIVVATLGSTNHFSRFEDVKAMTAWAFDAYTW
jgi:D-alanyl-D-alanine endopeptidase (penicillin-binding protein 7)